MCLKLRKTKMALEVITKNIVCTDNDFGTFHSKCFNLFPFLKMFHMNLKRQLFVKIYQISLTKSKNLLDLSRKSSLEFDDDDKDSSFVQLKKCSLVPVKAIFNGMQLFSFLMEVNSPGTIPEPCVLASCLDLVSFENLRKLKIFLSFKNL